MSNTKGEKHLFSFQYLFRISSSLWTEDALKKIVEWDVCIVWPPDDIPSTLYSTFSCYIFLSTFYVRERARMFSIRWISKKCHLNLLTEKYLSLYEIKCIAIEILRYYSYIRTWLLKLCKYVYMVFSILHNIWYCLDWHIIPWQRNESSPC